MSFAEILDILAKAYPEWNDVFSNAGITWVKSGTGSISKSNSSIAYSATYGGAAGTIATIDSSTFRIPSNLNSVYFTLYAASGDLVEASTTLYWIDTDGKSTKLGSIASGFDRNGKTITITKPLSNISNKQGFFRIEIYCGSRPAVTVYVNCNVSNLKFI